jgi:tetratricopeptide (TPR) repeat protein
MNSSSVEREGADKIARWSLVLGFVFLAALGLRTISHAGFWQHLAAGRTIAAGGIPRADTLSFTAAGQPWVDASWLYDRLVYAVWSAGGAAAVTALHVLAVLGAFGLLTAMARRSAGGLSTAYALLLSAWLLAPRFVAGAGVAGLLFAAAMTYLLRTARRGAVLLGGAAVLQVLWANVHESFLLGPVLAAVFAADALAQKPAAGNAVARRRFVPAGALIVTVLVASFVNPYGPLLLIRVAADAADVASAYVQEWISPFSAQFPASLWSRHLVGLGLVIGAGGLVAEKRRLPIGLAAPAVLGAFMVVRSLRFIEWFALLAFPFFAVSLAALGALGVSWLRSALRERALRLRPLAGALFAVLALVSAGAVVSNAFYTRAGYASRFGVGVESGLLPEAADVALSRPDFPARAVNLATDGGYLAFRYPSRKVFADQRAHVYGAAFYDQLARAVFGDEKAWKDIEDRWQPEAVIVSCAAPGAGTIVRKQVSSGRWALAYFDGATAVLAKPVSANRALIRDAALQSAGLEVLEQERRRYAGLVRAGRRSVSPRLIGAADILLALDRFEQALSVYGLLTEGSPGMANAWLGRGICELKLGRAAEAAATLREACERMPRSIVSLKFLYDACRRAGMDPEAETAKGRALKLNPKAKSLFEPGGRPPPAAAQP